MSGNDEVNSKCDGMEVEQDKLDDRFKELKGSLYFICTRMIKRNMVFQSQM